MFFWSFLFLAFFLIYFFIYWFFFLLIYFFLFPLHFSFQLVFSIIWQHFPPLHVLFFLIGVPANHTWRILCKFSFLHLLFICVSLRTHVFTLDDDGLLKFLSRNASCVLFCSRVIHVKFYFLIFRKFFVVVSPFRLIPSLITLHPCQILQSSLTKSPMLSKNICFPHLVMMTSK